MQRHSSWLDKIRNTPAVDISQTFLGHQWHKFIEKVLEQTGHYNKKDCERLKQNLVAGFCSGYSTLKGYAEEISKQANRYYCDLFYLPSFSMNDVPPIYPDGTVVSYVVNQRNELFEINQSEKSVKQINVSDDEVKAWCHTIKLNTTRDIALHRQVPINDLTIISPNRLEDHINNHYAKILPRYDTEWFYRILYTLSSWNGKPECLSKSDKEDLEEFLALLNYFQNIEQFLNNAGQGNLEHSLFDTLGRSVIKEYSLGSLFSEEQLEQALNYNLIHENCIILISCSGHATSVSKSQNKYIFYNSNNKKGDIDISADDNKELRKIIYDAMRYQQHSLIPIGFRMFQLTDLKKQTEEHIYPTKEELYQKLNIQIRPANTDLNTIALMQAARVGDEESIAYLLTRGVKINTQCNLGKTALYEAAGSYQLSVVKMLLERHANTLLGDINGNTPLMIAIQTNYVAMIELLLDADYPANMKVKNKDGITPLALAISQQRYEAIILFLNKSDDNEFRKILSNLESNDYYEIFSRLAISKNIQLTEKLLRSLNEKKIKTFIETAFNDKNNELLKLFCENAISIQEIFTEAVKKGNLEIVSWLINNLKINPTIKLTDKSESVTPLILAARYGHLSLVNYLLSINASLIEENSDSNSALTRDLKDPDVIFQASIELLDQCGVNRSLVLYNAFQNNEIEYVHALLKMNVDIDLALCLFSNENKNDEIINLLKVSGQPTEYALYTGVTKYHSPLIKISMKLASLKAIYNTFMMIQNSEETESNKIKNNFILFSHMTDDEILSIVYETIRNGNQQLLESLLSSLPQHINKENFCCQLLCLALQRKDKHTLTHFAAIQSLNINAQDVKGNSALIHLMKNEGSSEYIEFLLMNHANTLIANVNQESPHSLAIMLYKTNKLPLEIYLKIENLAVIDGYLNKKDLAIKAGEFAVPTIFYPLKELPFIKSSFEHSNQQKKQVALTLRAKIANNESIDIQTFSPSERLALQQGDLKLIYQQICNNRSQNPGNTLKK